MKRKQSQNKEDEESPDSAYDTETEQFDKKRKLSSSGGSWLVEDRCDELK